jgi:hypothetical protein
MGYTKGRARRAAEKLTEKHIAVRLRVSKPKRGFKLQIMVINGLFNGNSY